MTHQGAHDFPGRPAGDDTIAHVPQAFDNGVESAFLVLDDQDSS
jgi:hypothetical protein